MKQFKLLKQLVKHALTHKPSHTDMGRLENLEPRLLMSGTPLITEFMALNNDTLEDDMGNNSDWLEIHNPTTDPIDITGWHLTDDATDPLKWTFPQVVLQPGDYMIVFASDENVTDAFPLHTNFRLSGEGEDLLLTDETGQVVHGYADYPQQIEDISYGLPTTATTDQFINAGDQASYLIPSDDSLEQTFFDVSFDDSGWQSGPTGLGYDDGPEFIEVEVADSIEEFSGTQGQDGWDYMIYTYHNTTPNDEFYNSGGASPLSEAAHWDGTDWEIATTGLRIANDEVFPGSLFINASVGTAAQMPVRRWTSDVAGQIKITGDLNNPDPSGDGVTARIFVDDVEIYTQFLNGNADTVDVTANVNVGSIVDVVVDLGTARDNVGDTTQFNVEITHLEQQGGVRVKHADSVLDWSSSGTQGESGWSQGYYNMSADGGPGSETDYDVGDFIEGDNSQSFQWTGSAWDWVNGNPPWTYIAQDNVHPNGTNNGDIHFAMRRWEADVEGTLEVEFSLSAQNTAGGNGTTGHIYHNGNLVFTRAVGGTDAAGYTETVNIPNVQIGDVIDFAVSPEGLGANNQGSGDYTDGSDGTFMAAQIFSIPDLGSSVATDVETEMKGVNGSLYMRQEFEVTSDPEDLNSLFLNIRYNDGFVAYLNGVLVAEVNAPDILTELAYNSIATDSRPLADTLTTASFNITASLDLLQVGTNVLAIQALNDEVNDQNFFVETRLVGQSVSINEQGIAYFADPTPMAVNNAGTDNLGPIVDEVTNAPFVTITDDIVVTAEVIPTLAAINNVELRYRVMYGGETTVSMFDDATNGDAVAGDGIYTAVLPAGVAAEGEMVRWYVVAHDAEGATTRAPAYESVTDSEQYHGTIIQDPDVTSDMPIFHWFTPNIGAAQGTGGDRGSLYYNGDFYDNVLADIHGQSTRGLPKKSFDFDFTRDHRFELSEEYPKMKDINLLSNYADRVNMRNTLAYNTFTEVGVVSHLAFPINVQLNGDFYAVYDFVEDGDDRWLDRVDGIDQDGNLYKMYNTFNSGTSGAEKKTNKGTPNTDLIDTISNLQSLTGQALTNYIYDHIDLASMANYLAGMVITSSRDCCHKNYYAYFDTEGTQELTFLPWDLDLSYGRNWTGSYHDYTMYADNPLFVGGNNVLISRLYNIPEFEEMYLRRLRSQMDQIFQAPGTPEEELFLENWVEELFQQIQPDSDADLAKWGQANDSQGDWPNETVTEAKSNLINGHIKPRRDFLYGLTADGGTTVTNPSATLIDGGVGQATATYFVPTDNSLGTSWTGTGFDDDSWSSGTAGFGYDDNTTYLSAISTTVDPDAINAGSTTIMTRFEFDVTQQDLDELQNLILRMKVDDGFVAYINGEEVARVGVSGTVNWNTTASNRDDNTAQQFQNFNITDVASELFVGTNILAIQVVNQTATSSDMLLQPELLTNFNATSGGATIPAVQAISAGMVTFGTMDFNPESGNQDEEYVQIVNNANVAADLTGWSIDGGIEHEFYAGTVIPANSSMYIAKDAVSFRGRATGPSGGQGLFVQGNYDGNLNNLGEVLMLMDQSGQVIDQVTSPDDPTDVQAYLRVTEINYHPADPSSQAEIDASVGDDNKFEFIELRNMSDSVTLDLTGVHFDDAITFDFTGSNVTTLAPGEFVLVVNNQAAFEARYGTEYSALIAGEYGGVSSLSNGGENIILEGADNEEIQEFDYEDDWYPQTDGGGYTLDIIDQLAEDREVWDGKAGWRLSGLTHGTPGRPDPVDGALSGDANYDGVVDLADLAKLATNFGNDSTADPLLTVAWEHGDFTGDGIVDLADLAKLATNFGQSGGYRHEGGGEAAAESDLIQAAALTSSTDSGEALLVNTSAKLSTGPSSNWSHIDSLLDQDEDELDYLI